MRARAASRLAWSIWTLVLALTASTFSLMALNGTSFADGDVAFFPTILAFATVGAVVASRRPANAMGWLFLGMGMLDLLPVLSGEYARYAFLTRPGSLPGGVAAAWVWSWAWFPGLAVPFTLMLQLFPHGHPPSPRWRPVAWASGVVVGFWVLAVGLTPDYYDDFGVENPLGIEALRSVKDAFELESIVFPALLVLMLASVGSLVVRFRRSRGEERQQLKWITYAGGMIVVIAVSMLLLENVVSADVQDLVIALAILLLPVSAGVAILRYRLYDIDRVINRTLVYGTLVGILGAAYFGGVVALRGLLFGFAGGSDLAIVVTTLAVAAAFRPVQRRIQATIDRRFYRRKYDAARTVETFAARLRDEIDLDTLRYELTEVARETMQPAHVSLWLRRQER